MKIEINSDQDRMKVGQALKKALMAKKNQGFFDWQWVESGLNEDETTFEFYWDYIDSKYIYFLYTFMLENEYLNPRLVGGAHDDSFTLIDTRRFGGIAKESRSQIKPQVCLTLTIKHKV